MNIQFTIGCCLITAQLAFGICGVGEKVTFDEWGWWFPGIIFTNLATIFIIGFLSGLNHKE